MTKLTITVPGEPVPKGRPRVNTKTGSVYTPKATKDAEETVAQYAKIGGIGLEMPWDGPIRLTMHFRSAKDTGGNVNRASDLDNYCKLCCDALNHVAFLDDVQVVELAATIERDEAIDDPYTVIVVERIAA